MKIPFQGEYGTAAEKITDKRNELRAAFGFTD